MMHKPLFLAAALALPMAMAGAAQAQPAPPPPPVAQAPIPSAPQPPAPPPPPAGMAGPGMGGPGMGPRRMPPGSPMMEAHGPMHGRHRGPPPSRAASFHFQRDDSEIHIHCAEAEPTRACVDAAAILLDKLATIPAR